MCRYQPKAYHPTAPSNPQQISPYLTHKLGPDFFNQVQLDKPFILEIEQDGLNDILSREPWPQPLGDAMFGDPVIIFNEGSISLMGTLEYKGVSSVLTMQSEPFQTPQGQISLNIRSIHLGILPIKTLVAKLAQKAFQDNIDAFEGEPEAKAITESIIKNGPFDPVFSISGRKVKISHFTLQSKLLTVTCVPLPESLSRK